MNAPPTKACPECGSDCIDGGQYCPYCGFPVGAVTTHREDQLIGKVLPGGYQVLELVGIGGMGRVYRAQQQALGRTVAVKVIHPHLLSNENSLARFLTEARAMSHLNHPNSVSVIDFGKTSAAEPYLVMEFLRGNNLAQVQAAEGPLPIKRIVNVLKQVLMALGEAHAHQIIHRDLKPENIVLEPMRRGGDFVKVVDFGLAKLKAGPPGTSITSPGIVCGTPDYMAPEQGRGDEIDGRSDLYAVGVVLFWLLTGRLPFEGSSPTQVVLMHIKNTVPDPRELAPQRNLHDSLVKVVFKALAKSPSQRYQDALEFADALDASVREFETPVPTQPRLPEQFVKCSACSALVPQARFCYECGARLVVSATPRERHAGGGFPLLGREEDLAALHRAWIAAQRGRRTLRLVGEPGVGKTRLVQEFSLQVVDAGGRALFVGPDPYWAEVAGHMLRRLLKSLLPNEAFDSTDDPMLRFAFGELFGRPTPTHLSPAERRRSFAEALRWAMQVAAQGLRHPMLIVVDDLDRVDGLSRQALDDLLVEPASLPILLLGIHTPLTRLDWPGEEIRILTGLSAALATSLLQRGSDEAANITLVEVGNRGIPPLYVEEALAFGLEGGSLPPARLADLIALRLAALEPEARGVVQAVAVLGEEVSEPLLAAMLGQKQINKKVVDTLIEQRMLKRVADNVWSLAHPLIQELSLHAIPAEVRRELHRRAGDLLQAQQVPLEVLAHHFTQAGDSMSALFMLEQVANRAQARGDDRTATQVLRRGLELAREELYRGELDDPMRAITIFGRKLGQALNRLGRFSDAEGVLLEVLDGTPSSELARIDILESLAIASQRRHKLDAAERYLRQAIDVATECRDESRVAGLERALGELDHEPGSRTIESLAPPPRLARS